MNFVLRASEDKLKISLLKTAWIPIAIYAAIILYKSSSFSLAFSVLLFGLFIVLGLVKLYVYKFNHNVYITDSYISGPSKFFGIRTKIKLQDYHNFKVSFKKSEMIIDKVNIYSKSNICISIDPKIHGNLKLKELITHLKSL